MRIKRKYKLKVQILMLQIARRLVLKVATKETISHEQDRLYKADDLLYRRILRKEIIIGELKKIENEF